MASARLIPAWTSCRVRTISSASGPSPDRPARAIAASKPSPASTPMVIWSSVSGSARRIRVLALGRGVRQEEVGHQVAADGASRGEDQAERTARSRKRSGRAASPTTAPSSSLTASSRSMGHAAAGQQDPALEVSSMPAGVSRRARLAIDWRAGVTARSGAEVGERAARRSVIGPSRPCRRRVLGGRTRTLVRVPERAHQSSRPPSSRRPRRGAG